MKVMAKNKIVVITGGSSGLGLSLAGELSRVGYQVYAGFMTRKLTKDGVSFLKLDVRSDRSCHEFIKKIIQREGRIDVLINCAGLSQTGDTLDFKSAEFVNLLQVNTVGPFRMIKEVVPKMTDRGGVIINVTSMNSFISLPHSGVYSASKYGLAALSLALRAELVTKKIRVVDVAPGFFVKSEDGESTPFLRRLFPYTKQDDVSLRIVDLIKKSEYPARVIVGVDAKLIYCLMRVLPVNWLYFFISYLWNKNGTLALRK